MVAQPRRSLMSVEEYLALDRNSVGVRYEFIDGYTYMMAGGSLDHSTIGVNITSLLQSMLRGGPCRVYSSDARIRLSETRYVYPDASISCDARDRGRGDIVQYPQVVVEVLSPSTEAYDRGRKSSYYRACPTIHEYVLVDTQRQAVEVHRRASENLWTIHEFGPGDQVQLATLNLNLPIDAVYENVVVPEDTSDDSSSA